MAVFTPLSNTEISEFLSHYALGELASAEGIAEGVSNTNYLLNFTDGKKAVLTLFEQRTQAEDLPFFVELIEWMANHNIPCPRPIKDKSGDMLRLLKDHKALLVEFLEGQNKPAIVPQHLELVGDLIGRMHMAVKSFPKSRANTMGLEEWRRLFEGLRSRADEITPGLEKTMADELDYLKKHWPRALPGGVIHADIFPDNVFFVQEQSSIRLSGIIDFYFSCRDFWAYDLAVCMNAWCFTETHTFIPTRARSLWRAYEKIRPLTKPEREAMPLLARAACMRFLSTRAYDWLNRPPGAVITPKDPMEYVHKLHFHQKVRDYFAYGL